MTDREEFEKFLKDNFLYDTSGFIQNEAERKKAQDESFVWRAWQARGALDAVRIKELESFNKHLGLLNKENLTFICKQKTEIAELTAKLDKAREALSFSRSIVETVRQGMRDTEWKTNLELKWWDALRPVIQEINVTLRELDK